MTILLSEIWKIPESEWNNYKIHFARKNDEGKQPLDVWEQDPVDGWRSWQEYRPKNNDFNRRYIFSLIRYYHEEDSWLFGGVFEVLKSNPFPTPYEVKLTNQGEGFIGRLKIRYHYPNKNSRVNFKGYFPNLEVQEILPELYAGRAFPGFDSIDLSFEELETLVRNNRPDWKEKLENMKGIYLITDTSSGKRYVGSASGEDGIWSRWHTYIDTDGRGGNEELIELVNRNGPEYARKSFRFALLEHMLSRTEDDIIEKRESFWKEILLTRGKQGLNRN